MVLARLNIGDYTNQVLNVIKAKFNLNDKSEALNKFAEICGDEFVEKEANDEYVKKVIEIEKKHFEKYGYKKTTQKEFNELFELS
ncbi:MAG: antitoxin [Candidatus Woesearchaeota archaeon]